MMFDLLDPFVSIWAWEASLAAEVLTTKTSKKSASGEAPITGTEDLPIKQTTDPIEQEYEDNIGSSDQSFEPQYEFTKEYDLTDFIYSNNGVEYESNESTVVIKDTGDIVSLWNPYWGIQAQITVTVIKKYTQVGNLFGQKSVEAERYSNTFLLPERDTEIRTYTPSKEKGVKHKFSSSMFQGAIFTDTADVETTYYIHLDAVWIRKGVDGAEKREYDMSGVVNNVKSDKWFQKEGFFTDLWQWMAENWESVAWGVGLAFIGVLFALLIVRR